MLKLTRQLGLFCRVRKKKRYYSYRGEVGQKVENLLQRNFKADAPNKKWVTDVTQVSLFGEIVYISPIMDLYNEEIVSYSISKRANFAQVKHMLEEAFNKIPSDTNLVLHSDQGWQYQMKRYQHILLQKGIRQSMSRKGNCLDNAVMENFFGHLKSELLYIKNFESMQDFIEQVKEYFNYYNNKRIKIKLKGLSPVQYRTKTF